MLLQTWEFQLLGENGLGEILVAVVWGVVPQDEQTQLVSDLEASVAIANNQLQ